MILVCVGFASFAYTARAESTETQTLRAIEQLSVQISKLTLLLNKLFNDIDETKPSPYIPAHYYLGVGTTPPSSTVTSSGTTPPQDTIAPLTQGIGPVAEAVITGTPSATVIGPLAIRLQQEQTIMGTAQNVSSLKIYVVNPTGAKGPESIVSVTNGVWSYTYPGLYATAGNWLIVVRPNSTTNTSILTTGTLVVGG